MKEPTVEELSILKSLVTDSEFELLMKYVQLLLSSKHNLIGRSTFENIWSRHIIDSLQLVEFLEREQNIIDFGAGGGLPSVPIAIKMNHGCRVHMIDKSPVKVEFLKMVSLELGLNTECYCKNLPFELPLENSVVISRAFKDIGKIVNIIKNMPESNIEKLVLLKGQKVTDELSQCENKLKDWETMVTKSKYNEGNIVLFKKSQAQRDSNP